MKMSIVAAAVLMLAAGAPGDAKMELVREGRSDYVVVLARDASVSEHRAAAEFKRFIIEMSGAVIPMASSDTEVPEKAVFIGHSPALVAVAGEQKPVGDEEYVIRTVGPHLVIAGGRLRGTMYGVYAFFEDVLGCRWYTSTVSRIPKQPTIALGDLNIAGEPAFEYREPFYTDAHDKDWAARNRVNGSHTRLDEETGGKIYYYPFVHSFAYLVPLEKYWDSHPEYFSMIEGKRVKDQTQLCMSNPDVVRVATEAVLQIMREHPDARIVSVSQNDWYNNCQCEQCRRIDEEEGSPSGGLLRFVNAIAAETVKVYPDKLIDTLAYQWTEKPPKITRPHENVRVRLCPIFCCEAHPYEQCDKKENVAYVENLRNWAAITDNLYIWHYNTSFANYLNPFPDWRQLPESARMYKRLGVKGVFWQGNYSPGGGGEFCYLRAYLLAKLCWNPEQDAGALMADFIDNYYGPSGPFIAGYIRLLVDKVTAKNLHFNIWARPVESFLNPDMLGKLEAQMTKAEASADSAEILNRVRHARLPLAFVRLMQPIVNEKTDGRQAELLKQLDDFVAECRRFGITHISEGEGIDAFDARVRAGLQPAR